MNYWQQGHSLNEGYFWEKDGVKIYYQHLMKLKIDVSMFIHLSEEEQQKVVDFVKNENKILEEMRKNLPHYSVEFSKFVMPIIKERE